MRTATFVLFAATLAAQSNPDQPPPLRGVYYHPLSGWVALPMHLLNPYPDSIVRDLLSVGHGTATAVIPGPHAAIQITGTRPMLYLRDLPESSGVVLVRQIPKSDYRELRMSISPDFEEWIHYRKQDLRAVDMSQASPGVLSLSPKENLTPGEYAVVTVLEPGYRGIRVEFDFAVQ